MLVRAAGLDDAEAIRAIYNLEVETSTATFDLVPRTLGEQQAWIAARSGAHATLVAVVDGAIIGFSALSPYKDRPAYRTTVEDSVYVRRDHHGQGIGRVLLGAALETARAKGFHSVMARVEASRTPSIRLHESCGFRLVGIERQVGRKFNRWLDVALLQCLLEEVPVLPSAPPGS